MSEEGVAPHWRKWSLEMDLQVLQPPLLLIWFLLPFLLRFKLLPAPAITDKATCSFPTIMDCLPSNCEPSKSSPISRFGCWYVPVVRKGVTDTVVGDPQMLGLGECPGVSDFSESSVSPGAHWDAFTTVSCYLQMELLMPKHASPKVKLKMKSQSRERAGFQGRSMN